ncbi:MAG TPA: radical SAM protein [Acidiphilium sp.]|nr:MAG: radical SAM protein [Acidiphilium sp. 21-60-14]OYV90327.1 MAG: radical SAM protein [Acidiphilium sp. 37-60-79]OZB41553.1 MAG: radical SAM protein [Acidiphilium sp. 34-60-192]HQT88990.1 radical SAM protein [Acidiphilium sp.]HQU24007.1 radical SAM protein [Acidiphilium sp.]
MFDAIIHATPPVHHADAPVLIFGGNYSNLQATTALLAAAARHRIDPAHIICTGDIIAYGADPQACVDLIRTHGISTIMGNCEEQLAADALDCGCGFTPGSACDMLANSWFSYARRHLDDDARSWMQTLPRRIDLHIGGKRLAIIHGAPSRINRFLFASDPDDIFAPEIAQTGCDGVIAGHSGLGFTRMIGTQIWHNAGAIGLPANDGSPRGWYSVLTPKSDGLIITTHPLDYDHRAAAAAMRRAELPPDYADAIETGIWPNLDILPLPERAATAQPQTPQTIHLPAQAPAPDPRPAPPTHYARIALERLETLWFNTGTLCNLACDGCYIESSPRNDRLAYLAHAEFTRIIDEARATQPALRAIGFTGGEPFMNPAIIPMLDEALTHGYRTLVLTNAMRPMQRHFPILQRLRATHGSQLALRVSLDHFTQVGHDALRGAQAWQPALTGLKSLFDAGFAPTIAARFNPAHETEADTRTGFAALFAAQAWPIDAHNPDHLVLFPEMSTPNPIQGVSAAAWAALAPRGADAMCRTSRMVVQRKGESQASLVACTLLPYTPRFDLGPTLAGATSPVTLDHPHCARFCVFGASSCMTAR